MSSSTVDFPFADLPVEIIRDIFEIASLVDKNTALSLTRVSKMVHNWIDPIIYRILHVDSSATLSLDLALRLDEKTTSHFASRVRYLCIEDILSRPLASRVFNTCSSVRSLCVHNGALTLYPALHKLHPRELVIHSQPSAFDVTAPIFQSVTHLAIDPCVPDADFAAQLASLPQLTHFAFTVKDWCAYRTPNATASAFIAPFLQQKQIRMVVLRVLSRHELFSFSVIATDPRVYVVEASDRSSLVEWETAARGRATVWERGSFEEGRRHDSRSPRRGLTRRG